MDKKAQWSLVGAAWFAALSVAGFGYLIWQRGGSPALPGPLTAQSLVPQANGTVRCPVTGELLQVGPDTPTVNYRGQTYYFSTAKDGNGLDARIRFLMDPDRYLSPTAHP
ncbi:MAG TPA: hypothetical protein VK842_04570 [bacterium]|nr:hypothetical protein [bacterium]